MSDPASALRARLARDLRSAMKLRDPIATATLRSVMAALDNASAVPAGTGGASNFVRIDDVPRKLLSSPECERILADEARCRSAAADEYERLGRDREAARLRAELAVIERYVRSAQMRPTEHDGIRPLRQRNAPRERRTPETSGAGPERPVEGFERQTHWTRVYKNKRPSELSWFQAEPALSLELIGNCGLAPGEPIIDVGGGASVLVDRLLERDHSSLAVLDLSPPALAMARHRLGRAADRVTWIESDITEYAPTEPFALWHDRAVFHFLIDPDDRGKYLAALNKTLRPGGHLVIATFAIGGPEQCSGLPVMQYDATKLRSELGPEFRLAEERTEGHVTPAGRIQQFAWFRFLRSASDGSGTDPA